MRSEVLKKPSCGILASLNAGDVAQDYGSVSRSLQASWTTF